LEGVQQVGSGATAVDAPALDIPAEGLSLDHVLVAWRRKELILPVRGARDP